MSIFWKVIYRISVSQISDIGEFSFVLRIRHQNFKIRVDYFRQNVHTTAELHFLLSFFLTKFQNDQNFVAAKSFGNESKIDDNRFARTNNNGKFWYQHLYCSVRMPAHFCLYQSRLKLALVYNRKFAVDCLTGNNFLQIHRILNLKPIFLTEQFAK